MTLHQSWHKLSDWASSAFGSFGFFAFHLTWWSMWILLPVEPFPYGLLTLIVSLESILLSGLILNATNRSGEQDRVLMEKDLNLDDHTNDVVQDTHDMVRLLLDKLSTREETK